MSDEKMRSSVDAARDPAQPVLPTVNPNIEKHQNKESASFHPSVYIAYVASCPLHPTCTDDDTAYGSV